MSHEPDLSPFVAAPSAPFWRRPIVARALIAATLGAALSLPLVSDSALSNACRPPPAEPVAVEEAYPSTANSPLQSLKQHDVVFYGEVVVPTRPCSLGYCAGIRVLTPLKGTVEKTVLITVAGPKDDRCSPELFQHKGVRWVVFADGGTSKTGIKYMHSGVTGPTYATLNPPDFNRLEAEYRVARAQLDEAIDTRLGRRVNR